MSLINVDYKSNNSGISNIFVDLINTVYSNMYSCTCHSYIKVQLVRTIQSVIGRSPTKD